MSTNSLHISSFTDDNNSCGEQESSAVRKTKRKTAGRNPARPTDAQENAKNSTQLTSINQAVIGEASENNAICGKTECHLLVDDGIECGNCVRWFHPTCANLSSDEFSRHGQNQDLLWFCEECLHSPMLRFLNTIIRRQEQLITSLEERVLNLESGNKSTSLNLTAQNRSIESLKPRKRFRMADSPTGNSPACSAPIVHVLPESVALQTPIKHTQNNPNVPQEDRLAHPIPVPKPVKPGDDDFTLICSNLEESQAPSLRLRQEEDMRQWMKLCASIGAQQTPVHLTRLSRHPNSQHVGEPRLLRVTLKSNVEVENVLLAAPILRQSTETRIFPDIPWTERQRRRLDVEAAKAIDAERTILIHGIPELPDGDSTTKYKHDCQEWAFIQNLLGVTNILTTNLSRLPRSPNYQGTGPRILKVYLRRHEMVTHVLETWYTQRRNAPPEIRLRQGTALTRKMTSPVKAPEIVTRSSSDELHTSLEDTEPSAATTLPHEPKNSYPPAQQGSAPS